MKKALQKFLHPLLVNLQSYRKKVGGKWYKIRERDVSGFATSEYWTQEKTDGEWEIEIKTEDYTDK